MSFLVALDASTIRRSLQDRADLRSISVMYRDWLFEEDITQFVRDIDQIIINESAGVSASGRKMVSAKHELVSFKYTFENRLDAIKFALRWK